MRLSPNFSIYEFEKSQTATRHGIDNHVPSILIPQIQGLVDNVLQPVREHFGPVTITSGYRSVGLNRAIGGSNTSQHTKGQAADFEVCGISNYEVACWIRDNLKFDQLILEAYRKGQPNSGWIHCSHDIYKPNRGEVMTADFTTGKVKYSYGLKE